VARARGARAGVAGAAGAGRGAARAGGSAVAALNPAAGGPPASLVWVASGAQAGARLDVALGERPEIGSRAAAQRLIEAGLVTVDGAPRQKRHRLVAGERIEARTPASPAADEQAGEGVPYDVAHEDEHLLVVDKPAGVVMHPAPGHPTGTLAQALAGRARGGPDRWRPGIVHRLDRDTSGLLVVAKSERVHRALQGLIRSREMRRQYLALVAGVPTARTGTIDAPLGRDRHQRTVMSTSSDRPRAARTHFRLLEALAPVALLELHLETGRTHQVRAHLAAIGHPVCGDRLYGGVAAGAPLGLGRQFLHSSRLAFRHPATGAAIDIESSLPAELASALDAARGRRPG